MNPKHKKSKKTIPLDDEQDDEEKPKSNKDTKPDKDDSGNLPEKEDKMTKKVKKEKKGETRTIKEDKSKRGRGGESKSVKDEKKKDEKRKDEKGKEDKKGHKKEHKKSKRDEPDPGKGRRRLVKHGKFGTRSADDSDVVAIDWDTDEGSFETKMNKKQLAIGELEATINDLKRENRNLISELAHIKPDLDKKTELIEKYDKRYDLLKNDFERSKLRNLKEKRLSMKYASEKLILNMLEVLDNMDRAVKETKPDDNADSIIGAIKQMRKQMIGVLEKEKVKPIDAVGKPFNPKYHDAMVQEKDDTKPDNTVLEEFTKGYLYKDKVLRPTKVKVSKTDKIPALKLEDEEMPEPEPEPKEEEEETPKEGKKKEKADKKEEKGKEEEKKKIEPKSEEKKPQKKSDDDKDKKEIKKMKHKTTKKDKKLKSKKAK